jgi:magnesium transporter
MLTARDVPCCRPSDPAGGVRTAIVGRRFESVDDVVVLAGERLVGLVAIERLLAAPADTPIQVLMDLDPPTVGPDATPEAIAWAMVRCGESSAAVVDGHGIFLGLISPDNMIAALLAEHDEDVARIGGYLSRADRARQAAEEPLARRLWHRLPWLMLGLAGAMVTAVVMSSFQHVIERDVLLVLFIPGVVYMAAAVGMQTQTLLIRGLSAGVDVRLIARREAATGILVGAALATVFYAFVRIGWADERVALAVSVAVLVASSASTLLAMGLPLLLDRTGLDPAFGSGPIGTVLQDLLSITTYFVSASLLAT